MLLGPRSHISSSRILLHNMQQSGRIYRLFCVMWVSPSCLEVYHNLLYDLPPKNQKIIDACDCPCDDLVEVETPPMSVMALSYIAQALVVTIVGLNMGFRYVRHCMQWISSIARLLRLVLFVFWNVKPGRSTLICGRKICFHWNIKRQLRHNSYSIFRIMGQIQV